MNTVYAMNLSSASSFPIDVEIFPICGDKAVKQLTLPAQTLLLLLLLLPTGWRDLLVRQADVTFTVFYVVLLMPQTFLSVCCTYVI